MVELDQALNESMMSERKQEWMQREQRGWGWGRTVELVQAIDIQTMFGQSVIVLVR